MDEYIEREKALEIIDQIFFSTDPTGDEQIGVLKCRTAIREEIPAADVAKVRRGKWYYNEMHSDLGYSTYVCSLCKKEVCIDEEDDKLNYCPHCGAKMDGSDEE